MIRSADPAAASTRRAARVASVRVRRRRIVALFAVVAVVIIAVAIATTRGSGGGSDPSAVEPEWPASVDAIPAPQFTTVAAAPSICDDPAVAAAVAAGDDEAVVIAAGGGAAFREAVVSGTASACVSLSDPARRWVVVNKQRPLDPLDYVPGNLVRVQGLQTMNSGILRQDAAEALQAMASAIDQSGVGAIGQLSGYRSYDVQVTTYAENVARGGQAEADISSARPGFSEHQLGITMDLMPCANGCGTLDDFGASPEGQWVAENSWQFGFVVRYEEGYTVITGYEAEPWHLRYLGPELARAYHDGGWHTLEEFFNLPAAPGYPG
ncbi:M15 family metallopeptidase [Microbacterium sp. cx-55]|uniref:M15 family metallopeptidase n=1 Tax=Microbacterium sp. cx-55 TaxID=2875948 RepID=UPI001CC1B4E3|nr:M15 family metallopeptidase [Microbacterium sp. cx-55]MBZ4487381.1 M15 family metallopeptidase [Microbacterium sp. cx-55]UGB35401.1 M15 family metallopeptidase [Microbacterium sp. cx-55]